MLTIGVSELQGLLGASRKGLRTNISQRCISDESEVHPFGRAFTAQTQVSRSGFVARSERLSLHAVSQS